MTPPARAHEDSAAASGSPSPEDWRRALRVDPVPWLLEPANPAVRHVALRDLLDRPADDPELTMSRAAAMTADPIASILAAQHPDGFWEKPGPGYATKYRGTVWQLIFLDQLGADPADERVRRACLYVLAHSQAPTGGFGASGRAGAGSPPGSAVIHCLNGNLLRALLGFGWLDDARVRSAIEWEVRAITGVGMKRWYDTGTSGPGFACAANERQPCAWGAIKGLRGLARIPPEQRSPLVERALAAGVSFLLGHDPAVADYPMGWGNTRPSGSWFRLGFPSGYVADVLQNLEVLCELGQGGDPRLAAAVAWLLSKQDPDGKWRNEYAYNGKTWVDFEYQGQPSKWVTLRACRVLRAVSAASGAMSDQKTSRTIREIAIDRAIYAVDDASRTYRYARRNPDWLRLAPVENERNRLSLDGYVRQFRDGRRKPFRYPSRMRPADSGSPSRVAPEGAG